MLPLVGGGLRVFSVWHPLCGLGVQPGVQDTEHGHGMLVQHVGRRKGAHREVSGGLGTGVRGQGGTTELPGAAHHCSLFLIGK